MLELEELKNKPAPEIAHHFFLELKNLIKEQSLLFLEIGRCLKIMRDEKMYKQLDYDTWGGFLGSGELSLKTATVYAYIGIYEIFILKFELTPDELADIPWDKLWIALPAARKLDNREQLLDLIGKAKTLSRSDLALEINEGEVIESGKPQTKLIRLFPCDVCNKYKIDDQDKSLLCICKSFVDRKDVITDVYKDGSGNLVAGRDIKEGEVITMYLSDYLELKPVNNG